MNLKESQWKLSQKIWSQFPNQEKASAEQIYSLSVPSEQVKSPKTNTLAEGLIERISSRLDEIASRIEQKHEDIGRDGIEIKNRTK